VANESLYTSLVTLAAWIDSGTLEVLRAANVILGQCYTVNLPPGSNSKKLKSRNAQTAAVVAEAVAASNAVYGWTAGNTLLAKKVVVLNEISEEARLFGGLDLEEVRVEQGAAISEKVDIDGTALFSSFTNNVGTTGVALTLAVMIDADYKASLSFAPTSPIFVLANKQVTDMKKDLVTTAAPIWANPNVNNLLQAPANPKNGFVGQILMRDVFQTNHVPIINSTVDRAGACFCPGYAIAVALVRAPDTMLQDQVGKRTLQVSTDFYYDFKLRNDTSGCEIISAA
jgi:hypothetical protein